MNFKFATLIILVFAFTIILSCKKVTDTVPSEQKLSKIENTTEDGTFNITYTYNDKDQISSAKIEYNYDGNKGLNSGNFEYDINNNLIKITNSQISDVVLKYSKDFFTVTSIDKKNIVGFPYSYDKDSKGQIISTNGKTYEYNTNGNLEKIYNSISKTIESSFIFDQNKNPYYGNMISVAAYFNNNKTDLIFSVDVIQSIQKNNLTKQNFYNNGNVIVTRDFIFKYNANGLPISRASNNTTIKYFYQ